MSDTQPQQPTQSPPPKDVIPPPPKSASPLHKHTGFIVAIVITSILLVIAAILAYLSWNQGLKVALENVQLQENNQVLQGQNTELQADLDEALAQPGPIPYYYTTAEDPFISNTELHAVDPITGEDTVVFSVEGYYQVFAQPARNWDGRIFLNKFIEGDFPGYDLYSFDTATGQELVPVSFMSDLPFLRTAMAVSPDGQWIAAAYDNPNDPGSSESDVRQQFIFWNLVTGEQVIADTLQAGNQFFSSSYSGFGGAEGLNVFWSDHNCARVAVYTTTEAGRTSTGSREYCLPDPPTTQNQ